MSYILHIDTSGDQGMVMLANAGKPLFQRVNTDARNHASVINVMVDEVLNETGIKLGDLAAVSVCGGPGSYTGLRIGLATAKGICYVNDKPLLIQNKLVLLALQEREQHTGRYQTYGAMLPAREKEYFACLYDHRGEIVLEARHMFEAEIVEILGVNQSKTLISGLSIISIKDIEGLKNVDFTDNQLIDNNFWASYSFSEYNCNGFVNLAAAEPFYLKQVYTHNQKTTS